MLENPKVFLNKKKVINNEFKSFGIKGLISKDPFLLPINNFYLTDSISKSSKIMKNCSELINNKN